MELGLSLGEPSKALNLLERGSERQLKKKSSFENGGRPNVCVALGLNTYSSENRGREKIQKKSQECEAHEDGGPNISEEESRAIVNIIYYEKNPVQLDLLPQAPVIPRRIYLPWCSDNYFFKGSSDNGSSENMGLPAARGMNRPAEEASSANSVGPTFRLDSVGGKRDFEGVQDDALLLEGDSRASDGDEGGVRRRKKLRLSKQQSAFLEETFKDHHTLNPKQKLALAEQLSLRPRQVEVWFQNRRARTKLKQTEMDCEYLKRCCNTLRHENQRLQKELQELRALKISAPFCSQSPATTLTMCPSCERVAGGGGGKFSKTDVIPFALNRSKFFPFSQNSVRHPPQSAGGVLN